MSLLDNTEAMTDDVGIRLVGHVLIKNKESGEILLDKLNAIHPENMSQALAFCIADRVNGHIYQMAFGNGGSTVLGIGTISYLPPNTTGLTATLYNETYRQIVDDSSLLNTDSTNNYINVLHTAGVLYTDVQITCTLGFNEPVGQAAYDNSTLVNGSGATSGEPMYIFDELGLISYNNVTGEPGMLLTHVIFHPVQKALNVSVEVIYTIRISLG